MSEGSRRQATPPGVGFVEIADEFESREFGPDELAAIKKTRRRSPRLGEAKAEVQTFRAPPSLTDRMQAEGRIRRHHREPGDPRRSRRLPLAALRALRDTVDASLREIVNAKRRLELVALLSESGRYDIDALDGAWGGDD